METRKVGPVIVATDESALLSSVHSDLYSLKEQDVMWINCTYSPLDSRVKVQQSGMLFVLSRL